MGSKKQLKLSICILWGFPTLLIGNFSEILHVCYKSNDEFLNSSRKVEKPCFNILSCHTVLFIYLNDRGYKIITQKEGFFTKMEKSCQFRRKY